MASYDDGKRDVCEYITANFRQGSTCLDVGACDGKWCDLLGGWLTMDAVEVFEPNILYHHLDRKYHEVYACDIYDMTYDWYDLIIFGDVIEHMTVDRAQKVLRYAEQRCNDMIIGVPFMYVQPEIYGNKYEKHIQDDLTEEIFNKRYPGYEILLRARADYFYFHAPRSRKNARSE